MNATPLTIANIGASRAISEAPRARVGQLFLSGFSAVFAGFVTKRAANATARRLGLPQTNVRAVFNRFWSGWMIAQAITPTTLRVWDHTGAWIDIPMS